MENQTEPTQKPSVISSASVTGRDHLALYKNNQDSTAFWLSDDAGFGVACDGCGSGKHSEVGAALSASILSGWSRVMVMDYPDSSDCSYQAVGVYSFIHQLVNILVDSLRSIRNELPPHVRGRSQFTSEFLLATVVGFVWKGNKGAVFQCGDGIYLLGDEVTETDQNNTPRYPAYVMDRQSRREPEDIQIKEFDRTKINRVSVATDGFNPQTILAASELGGNGLQRWMNVSRNNGHFRDDSSIVTARW